LYTPHQNIRPDPFRRAAGERGLWASVLLQAIYDLAGFELYGIQRRFLQKAGATGSCPIDKIRGVLFGFAGNSISIRRQCETGS
jgi:hypothetical protein